jgi:molybdenum cofactor cytidylyltransferase
MGRNKLLLELDGEPMVRRAVRGLQHAAASPVIVVTGAWRDEVRAALEGVEVTFAESPAPTGPTSASLHAGLSAVPAHVDAVIVMLADMPHVTPTMIATLMDRAVASPAPLVVSRYGDVLAPPLLFRRALFAELLAWHGEGCGKAVVKRHAEEAVYVDWPASALADIDTPADYREALIALRADAPSP